MSKLATFFVAACTLLGLSLGSNNLAAETGVTYNVVPIRGVDIFYREAGPASAPTVLLLHGFPTSSHMFRELIPALAGKYHVVAPDYPGFGNSSAPSQPSCRISTRWASTRYPVAATF